MDNKDYEGEGEGEGDTQDHTQGEELEGDDLDYVKEVSLENDNLVPLSSMMHRTHSQKAKHEDSSFIEIMSDEDKSKKNKRDKKEVKIASKEKVEKPACQRGKLEPDAQDESKSKADLLPEQKDPEGEDGDPVLEDPSHKEPNEDTEEDVKVKKVSLSKFDSKDHVIIAALTEACNKCYLEDHLTIQKVWGSIMVLKTMPTTY